MFLIVGLGNPGEKYKNTRHNIGFRAVDGLAADFQFSAFDFQKISNIEFSKGEIGSQKIILAKPQTFMNESGRAVKKLIGSWSLEIGNLIVIHDDIDLSFGKIKISKSSGSGGHKGVESIIENLGTKNFVRIRVGIQPERGKPKNTETFVIKNFTKGEEKILKTTIDKIIVSVKLILEEGLEKAMNKLN